MQSLAHNRMLIRGCDTELRLYAERAGTTVVCYFPMAITPQLLAALLTSAGGASLFDKTVSGALYNRNTMVLRRIDQYLAHSESHQDRMGETSIRMRGVSILLLATLF